MRNKMCGRALNFLPGQTLKAGAAGQRSAVVAERCFAHLRQMSRRRGGLGPFRPGFWHFRPFRAAETPVTKM
jgi:hypothetical protein